MGIGQAEGQHSDFGNHDSSWEVIQAAMAAMTGAEDEATQDTEEIHWMGKGPQGKGGGKGKPAAGHKGQYTGSAFSNKVNMLMQFLGAMQAKGGGKGAYKGGNTKGGKTNTIATGGCHKCGKPGHLAKDCRSNVEIRQCGKCGKIGHLAKDCRSNINEVEEPDVEAGAVEFGGYDMCAVEVAAAETQAGSWEILEAQDKPTWRKRIKDGHRVTYLLDSGAGKTIGPTNLVPRMKLHKTKHSGSTFRVANGNTIPNLGEVKLEGKASNGNPIKIKTQIADVTKPLAATSEMVDAGNLVVIHKQGGVIKTLSPEAQARVLKALREEKGPEVPVIRKSNTFLIEVDVMDQGNTDGFQPAKKPAKGKHSMDVDHACQPCGFGRRTWEAFWDHEDPTFPGQF